MKKLLFSLMLALACMVDVRAALPAGVSGSWYNPAQAGHGLSIEMLDGGRVLAFWYVYDPAGNPVHLYLDGRVVDRSIVADAYQSSGMRFGSFRPADHRLARWGTVEIAFSGCDAARIRWAPANEFAAWGQGETPLVRLSRIAGLACDFDAVAGAVLPAGTYSASWDRVAGSFETLRPYVLHAAVDRDGALWAAPVWQPGPTFVSVIPSPPMFIAAPAVSADGGAAATVQVRYATAFTFNDLSRSRLDLPLTLRIDALGNVAGSVTTALEPLLVERVNLDRSVAVADPLLRADFGIDDLVGRRFDAETIGQFIRPIARVHFEADGSFCIDLFQGCAFTGEVLRFETGMSMFEFELRGQGNLAGTYRGKGWVREDTGVLVLVGNDGDRGLGLVANERLP